MNADEIDLGLPLPRLLEIKGGDGAKVRFKEAQAMATALVAVYGASRAAAGELLVSKGLGIAGEAVTARQRETIRQQDERIRDLEAELATLESSTDLVITEMKRLAEVMLPGLRGVLANPGLGQTTREYLEGLVAQTQKLIGPE